jgi:hypothetical protein
MSDQPHFEVRKLAAYAPMSVEMMLDYGMLSEDEARAQGWTPPPPVPRLRRLRWRAREAVGGVRLKAGRRVGSLIAGQDLYAAGEWE